MSFKSAMTIGIVAILAVVLTKRLAPQFAAQLGL